MEKQIRQIINFYIQKVHLRIHRYTKKIKLVEYTSLFYFDWHAHQSRRKMFSGIDAGFFLLQDQIMLQSTLPFVLSRIAKISTSQFRTTVLTVCSCFHSSALVAIYIKNQFQRQELKLLEHWSKYLIPYSTRVFIF